MKKYYNNYENKKEAGHHTANNCGSNISKSFPVQPNEITDPEIEEEDLMNPKDELKKKIVAVASTIRNWYDETRKARKSVREQLQEVVDLGLNKYKMQKPELRELTEEIFRYHGISESWLRKLLPEGLKDTSKTRISYLQKQEMEKERQRLLQQKASESQQELEARENVLQIPHHNRLPNIRVLLVHLFSS
jgi:hypothetical protein